MGLAAREGLFFLLQGSITLANSDTGELESSVNSFAEQCAVVLIGILDNAVVDLREVPKNDTGSKQKGKTVAGEQAIDDGTSSAHNMRLKLIFIRSLWSVTVSTLGSESSVRSAGLEMIKYLVYNHSTLVPTCSDALDEDEETHKAEAMNQWSTLVAQVAVAFPPETGLLQDNAKKGTTAAIWEMLNGDEIGYEWTDGERSAFWRGFARGWMEGNTDESSSRRNEWVWKGSCVILGLPFG